MVHLIVGYNADYVIGLNGQMPWRYKADMQRFKAITLGTTVVMGHKTWESLPRPLEGRRCVVLSRANHPVSRHPSGTCEWRQSLRDAIEGAPVVWVIGGAEVYRQALEQDLVETLDVTLVPNKVTSTDGSTLVLFPSTFLSRFKLERSFPNPDDTRLQHLLYRRFQQEKQ